MSKSLQNAETQSNSAGYPLHISYESVPFARSGLTVSYIYEVACSLIYPAASGHISIRVSGRNTYRNTAAREIPFTRHETGVTAYVELNEAEQLEVRIIEEDGTYNKAYYYAHGQELVALNVRGIHSMIQRIDSEIIQPSES